MSVPGHGREVCHAQRKGKAPRHIRHSDDREVDQEWGAPVPDREAARRLHVDRLAGDQAEQDAIPREGCRRGASSAFTGATAPRPGCATLAAR